MWNEASRRNTSLQVIDCDIHPAMTSWTEVHPYLEKRWIEHLAVYGSHLRHAFSEALSHPRMSPDAARVDAYPEEGGPPGSSLELMQKQHLDPNGVEIGMLIPLRWNPGSQRNLDFGVALTRAMNTWQVERWVKQEPRLRASRSGRAGGHGSAVAEIDARGGDPNFTQILHPAAHRRAARAAPLLADLRGGRAQQPADHGSCRRHRRSSVDRRRLVVLLHGRAPHGRAGHAGRRDEPGVRRRVRALSKTARRHHGGRARLDSLALRDEWTSTGTDCAAKCRM